MSSVASFLINASDRNGYTRERFQENKIPNDFSDVTIFPFFGDIRSLFLLSSFLLKPYKDRFKNSKYFILASWPGYESFFPYVDEYWSLNDFSQISSFYKGSDGFLNRSNLNAIYRRNINEFFRDVVDPAIFKNYYYNGFSNNFYSDFKDIKRFLPFISSSALLGDKFVTNLSTSSGYKIFIYPLKFYERWDQGKVQRRELSENFWLDLVDFFLKNNIYPVIWQNNLSFDLSEQFENKCLFLKDNNMTKVCAAIRATGLSLNLFGPLSYLSLLSRTPYISFDERPKYFLQKDYEIDDLFPDLQKEYLFNFSTILEGDYSGTWTEVFKIIDSKIKKIYPSLIRDEFPTTGESYDVLDKKNIREIKSLKLGTRLLKTPKLD